MKLYKIILIFSLLLLSSCRKDVEDIEMSINFMELYLRMPPDADAMLPPILNINIKIKNNTSEKKIFTSKGSIYDKSKSRFIMIDTVNNCLLPLYSSDTEILMPKKTHLITARIDLRDIQEYLRLDKAFFDKVDFTTNKEQLRQACFHLINKSKIIYRQDASDVEKQKLFDKNVTTFEQQDFVNVTIPTSINFKK